MLGADYLQKVEKEFVVTPSEERFFTDFGIDLKALKMKRRSLSNVCLDWSEHRHHLAGALGHGLLTHFLDLGWITSVPSIRAIIITETEKVGFK